MIDVELQRPASPKIRKLRFWPFKPAAVFDSPLRPTGYAQLVLAPGEGAVRIGHQERADRFRINVEAGAIRYIDSGEQPAPGYGELWNTGSGFFIIVDPNMAYICNESPNIQAIVNVSFYVVQD